MPSLPGFTVFSPEARKSPILDKADFFWISPKMDAWFSQAGFLFFS
jgi:hypothetical protein